MSRFVISSGTFSLIRSGKVCRPVVVLINLLWTFLSGGISGSLLLAQPAPFLLNRVGSGFVSINGETNFSSFHLRASLSACSLDYVPEKKAYKLVIPVTAFKARYSMIEQDFRQMVNASAYPDIMILIPAAAFISESPVALEIELAGKTVQKVIRPEIAGYSESAAMTVQGKTSINWRELGLSPPRRLGGLFEVHETIFITFTLELGSQFNAAKY